MVDEMVVEKALLARASNNKSLYISKTIFQ